MLSVLPAISSAICIGGKRQAECCASGLDVLVAASCLVLRNCQPLESFGTTLLMLQIVSKKKSSIFREVLKFHTFTIACYLLIALQYAKSAAALPNLSLLTIPFLTSMVDIMASAVKNLKVRCCWPIIAFHSAVGLHRNPKSASGIK